MKKAKAIFAMAAGALGLAVVFMPAGVFHGMVASLALQSGPKLCTETKGLIDTHRDTGVYSWQDGTEVPMTISKVALLVEYAEVLQDLHDHQRGGAAIQKGTMLLQSFVLIAMGFVLLRRARTAGPFNKNPNQTPSSVGSRLD